MMDLHWGKELNGFPQLNDSLCFTRSGRMDHSRVHWWTNNCFFYCWRRILLVLSLTDDCEPESLVQSINFISTKALISLTGIISAYYHCTHDIHGLQLFLWQGVYHLSNHLWDPQHYICLSIWLFNQLHHRCTDGGANRQDKESHNQMQQCRNGLDPESNPHSHSLSLGGTYLPMSHL